MTPEHRNKISEAKRVYWANPENRIAHAAKLREYYGNPENKSKHWTPERRARVSASMSAAWERKKAENAK